MKNNKNHPKPHFILLFCFLTVISCKSDKETKIDSPVDAEEISKALKSPSAENLFKNEETTAFYEARSFLPAWNKIAVRNSFLQQLKKAGEEGLSFEDYHGKELRELLKNKGNLNSEQRATLEILLTDAFLKYADHLLYGKLDPKAMYKVWGIDRKQIDLGNVLGEAIEEQEIEKALSGLKPQNEIYTGLKKSLLEYREKAKKEKDFTKIAKGKAIKPGKTDERIPTIAMRLKQLGILDEGYSSSQERVYDKKLQAAVKEFQTNKGLATDVILGNSTIQELNMGAEQRMLQILANLERWRWYPRDFGDHYILINIPNYKLSIIKDGDTLQTYTIIAGAKESQTPIFSDSIQYIVINPEWHIPTSIRDKEIIPLASKNSNYLKSRNIYVTGPDGNKIDPSSINWSSGEAKNYHFTQGAGPSNSLGSIKIIYPNQYAIYLHDTPVKAIFNQNLRAESHGCIRVENIMNLAAYLVSDQKEWNLDKIQKTISKGKTKKVEVTQPISVYHLYWTAWRQNGETIFINDVYGLDKEVYTALKNG